MSIVDAAWSNEACTLSGGHGQALKLLSRNLKLSVNMNYAFLVSRSYPRHAYLMTDFSSLAGKFRIQKDGALDSTVSKGIKRHRESLVCDQCRRSKLRCDRGRPCGSCIKRNEVSCDYSKSTRLENGRNRNAVAEDKLLHLESVIKQLMQNQPSQELNGPQLQAQLTPPSDIPANSADFVAQSDHDQTKDLRYVGSTHWSAILDDIQELKTALNSTVEDPDVEDEHAVITPSLGSEVIFGSAAGYTLQDIISQYLPPKIETDRLIATYFRGETFIWPFIHTFHFQRQYREFWANPDKVKPLWMSIFFSVCCLASLISGMENSNSSQNDESSTLHMAAGHCLVLGEYQKAQQHSVEALALYALSKTYRSLDPSRQAGAILSMVMRMAFELGYHRDPDSFGHFTAFEGEMRRRFWSVCKQVDLMMNFQLGLPSNIRLENCDTKSPRNLQDSDFDADTKVLPQSRSDNEATKISWFIVKDKQMHSFSKVCQDSLSFNEKTQEEIIALDKEIRETYATTPEVLRTRPLSESIADSPFLIVTRIYLEFIYLKSLCVLHRKYMARGNNFSTLACVDAAKSLVSNFVAIHRETAPGGQLYNERWMVNNFTLNDFHLGTMILCLFVHTRKKQNGLQPELANGNDVDTEQEVIALLSQAHTVCMEKSTASRDAWRVSHAVRLTLNAVKALEIPATGAAVPSLFSQTDQTQTINPLSLFTQANGESFQHNESVFGPLDPFNFISSDQDSIDWTVLDQQMLGLDS